MKTNALLLLVSLTALSLIAANQPAIDEIMRLKNAGVEAQTILSFVKAQDVDYQLSASDIIGLKDRGLSNEIIQAMLSKPHVPPVAPVPPTAPPPEPLPPPPDVSAPPPVAPPPSPAAPSELVMVPQNPDVAYFYQELSPYGKWIVAEDGQWYWQPNVAVDAGGWRPYWDNGSWAYTDNGWYWTSGYPWGWAAFHYGRWHQHPRYGWIWHPDRVWAPAWVTWRTYEGYCGWAPLPPGATFEMGGGMLFHGQHVSTGFDFGLGWNQFSFCVSTDVCVPNRRRIREEEAHRIYQRTTVINNIIVRHDDHNRPIVVQQGIDVDRIRPHGRPIERVRLEDVHAPPQHNRSEVIDRQTQTLRVYRPQFAQPSAGHGNASPADHRSAATPSRATSPNQTAPSSRPIEERRH
jgi:hypothetical protein